MPRSMSDNFRKRFGDPARIKLIYIKDKLLPSQKSFRNEQIIKAYVKVLKGIIGKEITHNEILGKADISKHKNKIFKRT